MLDRPALTSMALAVVLAGCASSASSASAPPHPTSAAAPQAPAGSVPGLADWPRERIAADGSLVVAYQPQLEKWEDYSLLHARMAVSVAPPEGEPVLGALFLTARTETDIAERTVLLYDTTIVEMRFASVPEAEQEALRAKLQALIPAVSREIELDRILVALERGEHAVREVTASLAPPQIFVSTTPAVLVLLDGEPRFARLEEGAEPGFAVNTNWDLFQVGDGYFLRDGRNWLTAADWRGPWQAADGAPVEVRVLPTDGNWKEMHEAIGAGPEAGYVLPEVFVATTPAEMILLDGDPELEPVAGTQLQWVTNTESDLFRHDGDGAWYYAVSGRWFRAAGLDGEWEAATTDLPADFADFPADHERAYLRAAIAGTPEAEEAVITASIPQKATVDRSTVPEAVAYGGEPEFEPIPGAPGVARAVNTAADVLQVGGRYYLCQDAIWFVGDSPGGPWAVADSIPDAIYGIPAESPAHKTTYVDVYDADEETVTTGYTSGYTGVTVSVGVAMYGTGWYYPPYFWYPYPWYPAYYWHPYSYGVGAWYNPYRGTYGRGVAAYGPYGGYGRFASYNPRTGTYARGGAAWGPYQAGGWATAYNPSTGARGATRQYANAYERWGSSVVARNGEWARTASYQNADGGIGAMRTSQGGAAVVGSGEQGSGGMARTGNDDLYVGKDGTVYRRQDGQWQTNSGDGWGEVDRSAAQERASSIDRSAAQERASQFQGQGGFDRNVSSADLQRQLNRDAQARMTGQQRSQMTRSYSGGRTRSSAPRGGFRRR